MAKNNIIINYYICMDNLVDTYKKFIEIRKIINTKKKIDLSNYNFIDPLIIVLIFDFFNEKGIKYIRPTNHNVSNYVEILKNNYNILPIISSTYLPIVSIDKENKYEIIEKLFEIAKEYYNINNKNLFFTMLGELADNITQHSYSKKNFITIQKYNRLNFIEVIVYDDGIGIPGNFKKYNIKFNDDQEAIEMAINGKSTSNMYGENERGTGLNTTLNQVSNSNGEFLIISGSGGLYFNHGKGIKYNLNYDSSLKGTLVSFKLNKNITKLNLYTL